MTEATMEKTMIAARISRIVKLLMLLVAGELFD